MSWSCLKRELSQDSPIEHLLCQNLVPQLRLVGQRNANNAVEIAIMSKWVLLCCVRLVVVGYLRLERSNAVLAVDFSRMNSVPCTFPVTILLLLIVWFLFYRESPHLRFLNLCSAFLLNMQARSNSIEQYEMLWEQTVFRCCSQLEAECWEMFYVNIYRLFKEGTFSLWHSGQSAQYISILDMRPLKREYSY